MMLKYKVEIHPNQDATGLKLEEFTRRFYKYLERKKTEEPIDIDRIKVYRLRNGLTVATSGLNRQGFLEMRVSGDIEIFRKAIDSVRKIYSGTVIVEYTTPL